MLRSKDNYVMSIKYVRYYARSHWLIGTVCLEVCTKHTCDVLDSRVVLRNILHHDE